MNSYLLLEIHLDRPEPIGLGLWDPPSGLPCSLSCGLSHGLPSGLSSGLPCGLSWGCS
ncbi:15427_t:CDS:2 [Cetraspora pellucida]|uniref:15427_t:CDS:1 n=1 Tax=Cetraspora pellucida TaxID=1433469 RepID=A0A9N9HCM1_9GLOM|nr:15427_t:CDS:2 [Cetraspora pellucida]